MSLKNSSKNNEGIRDAAESVDSYRGVMVVVEHRRGVARSVSWQLLGEARRLADKLDTTLMAFVAGDRVEHLAREAIFYGADTAYLCEDELLLDYRTRPYGDVCLELFREVKPEIVLFGATATGRDLAGAIATRLPTGLTADCTMLDVEQHPSRLLLASRPAFSEKLMATILCRKHRPQMATARAGVFQALQRDDTRRGEIVRVKPPVQREVATRVVDFIAQQAEAQLEEADVIVAGGKGTGGPEGFRLLEELAAALGGTVGASRAAVDAGWMAHKRQIGQTGSTVRPKLLIAAGISGAVQFTVGMQNAETIVAVNKDPHAPIFEYAHYGIVGDLFEIIPSITAEIRQRRDSR